MNADDLIKAAPALAKGAEAVAAAIPFTAIVKRMLGPAADEVAEMWRDQVRLYRYERQLKCVQKAEQMARKAKFTPQAVPPKILFPLLEGASVEDDEDLHTMWSALLANAASPWNTNRVRPSFIALLKQMSPDEARLLDLLWNEELPWRSVADSFFKAVGSSDHVQLAECLDGLESAQLIRRSTVAMESMAPFRDTKLALFGEVATGKSFAAQFVHKIAREHLYRPKGLLTYRGLAFISMCRPPKDPSKANPKRKPK